MNFRSRTLVEVNTGLVTGLVSTAMAFAGMGVWSLILSGLFASLLKNFWLARLTPLRVRLNLDIAVIRRHAGYGAKVVVNDFIFYLQRETKTLLLSKMMGPAFLGLFNKAESLARLPNQMLMAPTMEPLFRAMSKVQDNLDQTKYLYYRSITLLTAYTVPVYVLLWWIAEPFIAVVYGPKWTDASAPMSILTIGGLFLNIVFPTGALMAARNRLGLQMVAQGINVAVVAAAALIGMQWGLQGVAWGIVVAQALLALHFYALVPRMLTTRPAELWQAVGPGLGLGALMFVVLGLAHLGLSRWLVVSPAIYLAAMTLFGGLCYAAAFLLLPIPALHSEAERWRKMVVRGLARLPGRRMSDPSNPTRPVSSRGPLRNLVIALAVLILAGMAMLAYKSRDDIEFAFTRLSRVGDDSFAAERFVIPKMHHLFDVGIVDADGDGMLDVFTSNHNYRQVLLLSDGNGAYRDVLTEWGLDQNRDFPHWEQSFAEPAMNKPGLYIYWLGESIMLRVHGAPGRMAGTLKMFSTIAIKRNEGFRIATRQAQVPNSPIEQTIVEFDASGEGVLELAPPSRGVPTQIDLAPSVALDSVFIGSQGTNPASRSFAPFLRDRHGLAWADVDGDGRLDVYITRGGVGGTIRILPEFIRESIADELMLTDGGNSTFSDHATEAGIQKKDCSGRHADWVDVDGDGRMELFVNCQDRGVAKGVFAKQLWRLAADGRYRDVATELGLGLPSHELIDYVWMDADDDGDIDLLTVEDKGFFLYVNTGGRFVSRLLYRPDFVRSDVPGLKAEVNNYWRFDSKLVVADFDNDGDLDVFCASKRGNVLLENHAGDFVAVKPSSLGLPESSLLAVWVDYDNDGWTDLYTVPEGLYRQTSKGRFMATGLLAVRPSLYQAAIAHWFDRDNDGRRDLLLALNENPSLWRWWQRPFRDENDPHAWSLQFWRNLEKGNHWLQIDIADGKGNRPSIGARVTLHSGLGTQVQEVGLNDSSFFSQGHFRLYFGLGSMARAERITVRWSDGRNTEVQDVAADRLLRIDRPRSP
jgi:hypothetical protein